MKLAALKTGRLAPPGRWLAKDCRCTAAVFWASISCCLAITLF